MMINEAVYGARLGRRGRDRITFASGGVVDNDQGLPPVMDGKVLKKRLREELVLQAQVRLPITYARLAECLAVSNQDGMAAIRYALERLMDDDADEGRPFLAAIAVRAFEPGLPAPWFFRKAENIGLFAGDPANVEAYAFHARQFHRAVRFHARQAALPGATR